LQQDILNAQEKEQEDDRQREKLQEEVEDLEQRVGLSAVYICCLLSAVCCLLSAICRLPSAVCRLPSAVSCLLSVCCLLSTF
jgi:hypothetical protein